MVDTPLSQAPVTRDRVLHDARAVLDVSEFDATQLNEGLWTVARLVPAPHSGSATARGAFIDGDTGRLVGPSGRPVSEPPGTAASAGYATIWYEGSYEITTALGGQPAPASGRYSWREERPVIVRGIPREHAYNPFARGGTVLCRFGPGPGDTSPFSRVCVLPEGFEAHVPDAARAASELAGGPSPEALEGWLTSRNPLLSTQAVRETARGQRFTGQSLRSMLGTADGYNRAVLHFTAVRDAQYLGAGVLRSGFDTDFAPGSDPDHRRAAALALFTAQLFAPEAAALVTGELLVHRERGLLAAAAVAEDPYVREAIAVLTPA
jgi:hypothetical protein